MIKGKNKAVITPYDSERPFNMAITFLERLDRRLDEAQQASSVANIILWYRILRSIYRQIHFKIKQDGNEKDEKKLNDLFDKAKIQLRGKANVRNAHITNQINSISLTNTEIILDELETKLNDLLYAYQLSYPEARKAKTFDEKIEESY